MFNMTPELLPGESVLRDFAATVYQVRNGTHSKGSNIRLFLTNQRILLKAGLGPQRPLGLHDIRAVSQEHVGMWDMVRIEFADGHLEWFTLQDQAQFLQALEAARGGATPLPPEATAPPRFNPGSGATRNKTVIIILIVAGVIVLCICLLALLLGGYFFLLQG